MSPALRVGAPLSLLVLGGFLALVWHRPPAAPADRSDDRSPAEAAGTVVPGAREQGAPGGPAVAQAPPTRSDAPRFDLVRVGARGTAVVAGRAPPGSEVVLLEDGRELGRARADGRGEWVILPADPVAPGSRALSLRARTVEGGEIAGEDTAVVVVPEPAAAPRLAVRPNGAAPPAAAAADRPTNGNAAATSDRDAAEAGTDGPLVVVLPPARSNAPPRALQGAAAGRDARLGVGSVDYDDEGQVRFAGTAPPGARLRFYADERHLGDATADPAGRWSLTPDPAPGVGRHTLRVDQLAAARAGAGAGAALPVAGRVEVPFLREHLPPGAIEAGRVVVQPGHSLWRLARQSYGRGNRYTVIYAANREQIRDPARIHPGQVLTVPPDAAASAAGSSSPAVASRSR